MRIRENVVVARIREIGEFDWSQRLPMVGRKRAGLVTKCDACGKIVEDDHFILTMKKGERNMFFHEACVETSGA